ncbi:MAG: hypothetical protein EOM05_01840 [Clostridia bacterium]|nr:hypothetical protein [Sphingobacteriia bacterium]NCC86595.1 hypothetical protein [Clostridia bacterium]
MSNTSNATNCENCAYYEYDDYDDCYSCTINLDEDEMVRFMSYSTFSCPYFKLYDEYGLVRKQN